MSNSTATALLDTAKLLEMIASLTAQLKAAQTEDIAPKQSKAKPKVVSFHKAKDYSPIEPGKVLPEKMKVQELKDYCKEHGLKVSGKKAELLARVKRHIANDVWPEDTKKARSSKSKAAPRSAYGLDYRRGQRLVKWLKDNMPSALVPSNLKKNTGWDGVEHNLTQLLTTDWFTKLSTKQLKGMAKDIVMTDEMFLAFCTELGL